MNTFRLLLGFITIGSFTILLILPFIPFTKNQWNITIQPVLVPVQFVSVNSTSTRVNKTTSEVSHVQINKQSNEKGHDKGLHKIHETFKSIAKTTKEPTYTSTTKPPSIITIRGIGRLGNKLFEFSAMYGIALTNNMQPVLHESLEPLLKMFKIEIPLESTLPKTAHNFHDRSAMRYDNRTKNFTELYKGNRNDVFLHGFFQSLKYFKQHETHLRKQLTLVPNIHEKVQRVLHNISALYQMQPVFIAIHIRRGDFRKDHPLGYITPEPEYFFKAMQYMRHKFHNQTVHFVVASNDLNWARNNLGKNESITYSPFHTAEEDMALLVSCNHTIISSGTYGWWAAWLANGITIYYGRFPPPNTFLDRMYSKEDYYPKEWIPMTEE